MTPAVTEIDLPMQRSRAQIDAWTNNISKLIGERNSGKKVKKKYPKVGTQEEVIMYIFLCVGRAGPGQCGWSSRRDFISTPSINDLHTLTREGFLTLSLIR